MPVVFEPIPQSAAAVTPLYGAAVWRPWLEIESVAGGLDFDAFAIVSRSLSAGEGGSRLSGEVLLEAGSTAALRDAVDDFLAHVGTGGRGVRVSYSGGDGQPRVVETDFPSLGILDYPAGSASLLDDSETGLSRRLSFEIRSSPDAPGGGSDEADEWWTESVELGPDGRVVASRSGTYTGDDAAARYASAKSGFDDRYAGDLYLHSVKYTEREDAGEIGFTFGARQLSAPLPATESVEGEVTLSAATDHRSGQVTHSVSADLLLGGNSAPVIAAIVGAHVTPLVDDGAVLVEESVETTEHDGVRLAASWKLVGGGASILRWQQSIDAEEADAEAEELTYSGATSVLVQPKPRRRRATQSGSATGLASFPPVPAPIANDGLAARPKIKRELVGAGTAPEYRVSWSYELFVPDSFDAEVAAASLAPSGGGA